MGRDVEVLAAVGSSRLFGGLEERHAQAVAAMLRPFSADEHETLFRSGAPVERLYLLRSGTVGVGDPVVTIVRPGDTLGELALNGPTTHTAAAVALEPAEGLYLETGDFDVLRSSGDPLAFAVLRQLALLLAARIRAAGDGGAPPPTGAAGPLGTLGPHVADEVPFLRSLPYFRDFGERDLETLARSLRTWRLEEGASLFTEGEEASSAFVVLRGAIEVTRERGDRRLRLAPVGPGRLLGGLSLIDSGPRTATCRAAEPAVVLEIDRDAVERLLDEGSPAGLGFLEAVNRALIAALHATDARRMRIGADWPVAPEEMTEGDRERLIER